MSDEQTPAEATAPPATAEKRSPAAALTPELVRAITEKVYLLWRRDLTVERERRQPMAGPWV